MRKLKELPIIDEFLVSGHGHLGETFYTPESLEHIRTGARSAVRYIFDPTACAQVGQMLHDDMKFIMDNAVVARPPHSLTYIEISDHDSLHCTYHGLRLEKKRRINRVGYLVIEDILYSLLDAGSEGMILYPLTVRLNRRAGVPEPDLFGSRLALEKKSVEVWKGREYELPFDGPDLIKFSHLVGARMMKDKAGNPKEQLFHQGDGVVDRMMGISLPSSISLRSAQTWIDSFAVENIARPEKMTRGDLTDAALSGVGNLIQALTCYLLLDMRNTRREMQTPGEVVRVNSVPEARAEWRGRQLPHYRHHVVTIRLGKDEPLTTPDQMYRRAMHVPRGARKHGLHDVEPTWVNYDKHPTCEHLWQIYQPVKTAEDSIERFKCSECGQRRSRREGHKRGDAKYGVITKEYRVKA